MESSLDVFLGPKWLTAWGSGHPPLCTGTRAQETLPHRPRKRHTHRVNLRDWQARMREFPAAGEVDSRKLQNAARHPEIQQHFVFG